MKALTKQFYQQFVDGINFPTIVYIYETGRVVSYNKQALDMLGKPITTVSRLRAANPTLKLTEEILDNGNHRFYNERFYASNEVTIEIDCEVNSIAVEDQHLLIVFFEYSFKQYFVRHNKYRLPRILWIDKKHQIMGCNENFRRDLGYSESDQSVINLEEILDEETQQKLVEDREQIFATKRPVHNMLQLIKPKNDKGYFCKIDRVPVFNKNNTVVGLLSVYMLIFNREEYEHFYSVAMRENNILNQMISKTEIIAISWMKDIHYSIQYVSSNVSKLGYTAQQCYSGELSFLSILSEASREEFLHNLRAIEEGENNSFHQKVQIKRADESFVWVRLYVGVSKRNGFNYYYECFIQEIVQQGTPVLGRNTSMFEVSIPTAKNEVENRLKTRLHKFCTYFQPIVEASTNRIIGLGSILRYKSEDYGIVDPKDYLNASEYLEMTMPLAEYSMQNTMKLFSTIPHKGMKLHLSVNSLQLIQPNYAKLISSMAREFHLCPEEIVLEMKESLAVEDFRLMKELLISYKAEGFQIAICKFNGCKISLNRIEELPVDLIKTDKALLQMFQSEEQRKDEFDMVMGTLAESKIDIIVDGVELKRQYEFLCKQDFLAYQGNYFCVPLNYENIVKIVEENIG
ncbi:MAG: EAL domain-containing protein [bacterium]|nr:EAL domain-containing protein [bacterium]